MSDSDIYIGQTINKTVSDSSPLLDYDPNQPTQDPTFGDEPGITVMDDCADNELAKQVDSFRKSNKEGVRSLLDID